MRIRHTRRYDVLVRVKKFGETHRQLFPESTVGGKAFATVAAVVDELGTHALSKMSTDRRGLTARIGARAALRGQLGAIARTARQIAVTTEGLDDKFLLPDQPNDRELITTGRLFVRDVAAFEEAFVAHALPPTFVADLAGAVDGFAQALDQRDGEREQNIAAKASIEAALEAGFVAVRRLDVIVANSLKDDAVTMQVWKADRRVGYPPRRAVQTAAQTT